MSVQDRPRKYITNNVADIAETLQTVRIAGKVITDNISSAAVKVGSTNILKLHVSADTYVAFSDDPAFGAVSVTTTPAVLLPAGMHYVICTGEYVRASANPTRIELLQV